MSVPFYNFRQNNPGGKFDYDEDRGISVNVIIEANSPTHANGRAVKIGLYFDGCEDGQDCNCCGDRWYPVYHDEPGDDEPTVYGHKVEPEQIFVVDEERTLTKWVEGYEGFIHHKDGSFYGFWKEVDDSAWQAQFDGRYGYGGTATASSYNSFPVGCNGFAPDGNRQSAWTTYTWSDSIYVGPAKPEEPVVIHSPTYMTSYLYHPNDEQWVMDEAVKLHEAYKKSKNALDKALAKSNAAEEDLPLKDL